MRTTVFAVLQRVYSQTLWISIACFVSSVEVLGLVPVAWRSIVSCVLWAALVGAFSRPQWLSVRRIFHYVAPLVLCLASLLFHPYLAATLAAGWLCLLASASVGKDVWLLRQYARAILLFEVVELLLLKHSMVDLLLVDLVHGYTRLIRASHGAGDIVGPSQIEYRLLVFSIVVTTPLMSRGALPWLLTMCQAMFVIAFIPLRVYVHPWAAMSAAGISSCMLVGLLPSGDGHDDEVASSDTKRREWALWALRLAGMFGLLLSVALGGSAYCERSWGRPPRPASGPASSAQSDHSILFLNDRDRTGKEGDERDMTHFGSRGDAASAGDFDQDRRHPLYDKLAKRFLPALGYRVSIKSLEEVAPEEYVKHRLVVLICIQNKMPAAHRRALYECIRSGRTNLLIAGDHTDIRGVRGPFNDLMVPLGVELNYDSAIPFGQWYSQIVYSLHPVNGLLALAQMGKGGDPGVSVGGSLTLDKRVSRPVLEAGDGFADQGTPDAPMIAGLGDMSYTTNEVRGGLVLAAERPYGNGTVMAFGDTAFLQNGSLVRNFTYVASVFEFLTRRRGVLDTMSFMSLALLCGTIAACSLAFRFSWKYAIACVALGVASIVLSGALKGSYQVIRDLHCELAIIDNCHGEGLKPYDRDKNAGIIANLIDRTTSLLTLETNALEAIDASRVRGILLFAPRGAFGSAQQNRLVQFVLGGGGLLFASGFPEAEPHAPWLRKFGCRIAPVPLGAGQQVSLVDKSYGHTPRITETWGLELSNKWRSVLTCYERPVVALRDYGAGRVCIVSDGSALLDGAMGSGSHTNKDSFIFFSRLLDGLGLNKRP
jgi:hypothetical protein